jgi:hypothetical protein
MTRRIACLVLLIPLAAQETPLFRTTTSLVQVSVTVRGARDAPVTGLTRDDYAEEFEVWPENWETFSLITLMETQWEVGFSKPIGLKYPVLFDLMDRRGLSGDDWWQVFNDVRAMEAAALKAMGEK